MKVGLLTRISRSSRIRDEPGSSCSLDVGRPNLPKDIFDILDFSLFFFLLSKVLFALLKLSSALSVFSSTTLVLDLLIKSSAKDTFGLGSRLTDARVIDERKRFGEFCLESELWLEYTSRLELGGLMPDGTTGSLKLSRVGLG